MAACAFLFDFIVVRIDAPSVQIDNKKLLTVEASFNNIPLRVTSSRINVVEFKPRRSFEFNSTPEDLKRDLSVCPLKLSVFYDSNLIGSAEVPWVDFVLDRIKPGMADLTHIDETKLLDYGDSHVGTMEYICRLQCKCEEPSDEILPTAVDDIKNQVRNIIDPNDVLFIVTQPNKEEMCPDDFEPSGDGTRPVTALDLSPYRVLNGRLVQNTNVINTCHDMECCDFLKAPPNCQRMVDSLTPCNKKKKGSEYACQAQSHCKECPHENKYSTHCSSSSEVFVDFKSAPCGQKNPKLIACGLDIPLPDNRTQIPKTPRNCPICNSDLRWLPKLAACPKCGYKPVPVNIEEPYNETLTATEILTQYLENRSSESCADVPKKTTEKGSECRCSCTYGKTCANCRVRKQCEDFLTPKVVEEDPCAKCGDDSDECAPNKDCRPQLARVFSELKDLFNVTPMKQEQEINNEKCEKEFNPPKDKLKTQANQIRKSADVVEGQNLDPSSCYCSQGQKKMKRYRKKRRQICSKTTKAICRAPPAEPAMSTKEELLQKFHDACVNHRRNVPSNMGWLWNASSELGAKWRPGAIRKPVKDIMRYFLRDFPADTIPLSRYSYPHRRNQGKCNRRDEEDEEDLLQQPTLHICKKNGEIYITLRPLKNPDALKHCANPYLKMNPIQFKIVKNPLAAEIKRMKQCLKDMGYPKCTCNRPIIECFCRSFLDKKRLEYQLRKECKKRGLEDFCDTLRLSDTSDSEAEYDFSVTPPAGLVKKERSRRPDKVNVGTQYERCDWNPPVVSPLPPNNIYMKWINCATGHKYAYRRASDLLTIGQKEAILCQKRKEEEAAQRKAGKGRKTNQAPATEHAPARDYIQKCPDGTKVNMRKYLDAKPKAKK